MITPDLEVQIGQESQWGTAVATTAKLMGVEECTIKPLVMAPRMPDRRGSRQPAHVAAIAQDGGEASLSGFASYEDVCYLLDGIDEATPSGTGPYVRAYSGPDAADPSPCQATIIQGGDDDVRALVSAIPDEITFTCVPNEALKYAAHFWGYNVQTDALEELSDRTVNPIMHHHFALYIDAAGGTIGSTEITTPHFAFEYAITTNRALKYSIGNLQPVAVQEARYDGSLKLTLEVDATTAAYLDTLVAASSYVEKQIRLKATDTTRIFQLDFAGILEEASELYSDQDGVVGYEFVFNAFKNAQLANWFAASVTNAVSALP